MADRLKTLLMSLRRPAIPEEQKRIVRQLHRIGAMLLSEPETFPDPVVSGRSQVRGMTQPTKMQVKPVDPDTLIRSLTDMPEKTANIPQ